jgi:hypothetical protein
MSFILQDKNLANLLAYHGLSKKAQQYVAVAPQDFATLRGIIANLEKQITSPTQQAEIGTDSEQPVSINSVNLENVGSLVEFLATNKITFQGKRIAYTAAEKPQDPSYPLYKLQGSAGLLELANRNENVEYGYYINKDLLKGYLNSLQGQLAKNPNPVMNAQVQAVVQQANDELDTGVDKTYQEPEKTLPPNQPLDRIPQNVRTNYPTLDGNVVLTFGDIASDTSFNAWIQQNNIGVDGRAYRHPQYDKCGLVKVLSDRAKSYVGNATSAQQKEQFTIYLSQVGKLASAMQCDLGGSSTNKPGVTEQQGGQGQAGGTMTATLQQLVESLPLERDQLDFGKIRAFIEVYQGIVSASSDSNRTQQASVAITQLQQYMQAATQNTVGQSMTNFSMDGLSADDLISWSTPPSAGQPTRSRGSAKALADYLEYIVRNTYTLVKDLYNAHYRELASVPQLITLVEQQVGGRSIPFGSSIAANNLNNINVARSRLPQVGA